MSTSIREVGLSQLAPPPRVLGPASLLPNTRPQRFARRAQRLGRPRQWHPPGTRRLGHVDKGGRPRLRSPTRHGCTGAPCAGRWPAPPATPAAARSTATPGAPCAGCWPAPPRAATTARRRPHGRPRSPRRRLCRSSATCKTVGRWAPATRARSVGRSPPSATPAASRTSARPSTPGARRARAATCAHHRMWTDHGASTRGGSARGRPTNSTTASAPRWTAPWPTTPTWQPATPRSSASAASSPSATSPASTRGCPTPGQRA